MSDLPDLPGRIAGLVRDLASPDPVVRDEGAYATLAQLAQTGELDARLVDLSEHAVAMLVAPAVQARSFGALLAALVVDRDNRTAQANDPAIRRLLAAVVHWYLHEHDTRGHVADLGWLHAVAHGADALAELASSPRLGRADLVVVLDALVRRASGPGPQHWLQNEDDRIAVAIMAVLRRDLLDSDDVQRAVGVLAAGWRGTPSGPVTAVADNSVRLARTWHLQLVLGVRPEPDAEVVHPVVRNAALRSLGRALAEVHWFYGPPA